MFYSVFGVMEGIGYTHFFYFSTALAVPGMLLLFWVAPWNDKIKSDAAVWLDGQYETLI